MSAFDFVAHESYPQDQYIAESCTLCLEGKHRVTYLRKKMKNGGMFWDVMSAAVTQHGQKKYLKAYAPDSNFLRDDIQHFLENRSWEKSAGVSQSSDQLPF